MFIFIQFSFDYLLTPNTRIIFLTYSITRLCAYTKQWNPFFFLKVILILRNSILSFVSILCDSLVPNVLLFQECIVVLITHCFQDIWLVIFVWFSTDAFWGKLKIAAAKKVQFLFIWQCYSIHDVACHALYAMFFWHYLVLRCYNCTNCFMHLLWLS